jgi:hypothetical protein
MVETYWQLIKKLEDNLENQDTEFIIKYILELKKHKLLNRYMLASLADSGLNQSENWNILHELAGINFKE